MLQYLFFDTETTGVPRNYKAPTTDTSNWPRLVQLSWIVTNEVGKELKREDYIVRPDGFVIPREVTEIHGISTEKAKAEGEGLRVVMDAFMRDFKMASLVVGHNVDFDKKIVGAELVRLGQRDIVETKQSFCTMNASIDFCKIAGPYGYKWPKLQELHKKLFGYNFEDAHNSASDIDATCKCFWEMCKRGLIKIEIENSLNSSSVDSSEDSEGVKNQNCQVIESHSEQIFTNVTDEDIKNGIKDEYGVIYSRDGRRLLKCTKKTLHKKYVIKRGTRVICKSAFYFCWGLMSIEIPDSVTSIGDYAFGNCGGLTSIKIPNSVMSIGDSAFAWNGLTSIEIPDSVTSIGQSAFGGCHRLTSINVSIKNRCYDSRENCNAIIESKTNKLISGCANTKVPDSVTSIGDSAFAGSGLTSINIPDSVMSIGKLAFYDCEKLTNINISGSVMSIGYLAFGQSGLTSINVSVKNRYYDSRENCNAIIESKTNKLIAGCAKTKVPNSVMSIGDRAFSYCSGLISIEIPDSVTSIGDRAFENCWNLTSIEIPDSVTSIGNEAFAWSGLTSIEIPDSVTTIGESAFGNCEKLTSIKLPKSVTSIGDYAFAWSGLTSIEIPDSVMSIGEDAFGDCENLTSIEIPDSVTSIGESAFEYCFNLIKVEVSPKNKFYHTDENKTRLIETKTGKVIWKRNR